jgi:predicted enzyme related to lactoylglutathione lyase
MDDRFKQHGAFSWCELMAPDAPAAQEFYTKLFGWKAEQMGPEMGNYIVVKASEQGVGGIMATPPQAQGRPPAWTPYITVDDIDATARSVEELGGKVCLSPQDIPNVGRFAVFQDPQGATIAAITYKMPG